MDYSTEDFNAIKKEPVLWRVPFFILSRVLVFTLGGTVVTEVIFKIFGFRSIGNWLFIIGALITIGIFLYFRSTSDKLSIMELKRFLRNLNRVKKIT